MKRTHPKTGRNEPCHCGSGVKYKKCHLETDQLRDRFPLVSATPLGGGMFSMAISLDGSPIPEGGHADCPICQAKTPAEAMRLMREMSGETTH